MRQFVARAREAKLARVGQSASQELNDEDDEEDWNDEQASSTVRRIQTPQTGLSSDVLNDATPQIKSLPPQPSDGKTVNPADAPLAISVGRIITT